jgi:hypothetical protein
VLPPSSGLRVMGALGGQALGDYVKAEIRMDGSDIKVVVKLENLPADYIGAFRGQLVIPVGHPKVDQLIVPVFGLVRAAENGEPK